MKKYDFVLLTEDQYIEPKESNWYIDNVLLEDRLVKEALESKGLTGKMVSWSDPGFDWCTTRLAIFRTTWDYFHRFDEFKRWMQRVKDLTQFVNPIEQIQWNMDKHYLKDLNKKGIPVVESCFLEKGDSRTLAQIHQDLGWSHTVIKPCISGAGRHTYKLNSANFKDHETIFREVISNEAMILQPFQEQIVTKGEVSHIVIGGKHTHSILKRAKEGDYRVQDDFGGTVHEYQPSQSEIDFAVKAVKACDPEPMYARVDIIWNNDDDLVVSELELIEPELWFRKNQAAATQLANCIKQLLD